jgi:hypothetical protein
MSSKQLAMFKSIAADDHGPNEHGLFDIHQLAHLVVKRSCEVIDVEDYSCEIRYRSGATIKVMAHDADLWHPVNIFRACREAAGRPHYMIDYAKAKITNPGDLDEVRIAAIIGADGVRPHLSRPSRYFFGSDDGGHQIIGNSNIGYMILSDGTTRASAGNWTWLQSRPEVEPVLASRRISLEGCFYTAKTRCGRAMSPHSRPRFASSSQILYDHPWSAEHQSKLAG